MRPLFQGMCWWNGEGWLDIAKVVSLRINHSLLGTCPTVGEEPRTPKLTKPAKKPAIDGLDIMISTCSLVC